MRVAIVGSGPSGVAAATQLVDSGVRVEILDVGHEPEPWANELRDRLRTQALNQQQPSTEDLRLLNHGPDLQQSSTLFASLLALARPSLSQQEGEIIKKRIFGSFFVYRDIEKGIPQIGPNALNRSLAAGGLSNVWGTASYALRPEDYARWPISQAEMLPFYKRAANLLNLEGTKDHARPYLFDEPLDKISWIPNPSSPVESLLAHWRANQITLNNSGYFFGRSQLAVNRPGIAHDMDAQCCCVLCGLCLSGCPVNAMYTSKKTLAVLLKSNLFLFRNHSLVITFKELADGVELAIKNTTSGAVTTEKYDRVILAAGAVSSTRIVADSLGIYNRPVPVIDNDLWPIPLLKIARWGHSRFQSRFTLSEAVLGLCAGAESPYGFHIQFYSYHPFFLGEAKHILDKFPRPLQRLAAAMLNQLLIGFFYAHSSESRQATLRVQPGGDGLGVVELEIQNATRGTERLKQVLKRLGKERKALGFIPLTFLTKNGPLGLSGHLGGTLPMKIAPHDLETHIDGRLGATRFVYVADASTFPVMPPQNATFTIMANAMRIAACVAEGGKCH